MKADFLSQSWRPEKSDIFFLSAERKNLSTISMSGKSILQEWRKKHTPHPQRLVISRPILKNGWRKFFKQEESDKRRSLGDLERRGKQEKEQNYGYIQ